MVYHTTKQGRFLSFLFSFLLFSSTYHLFPVPCVAVFLVLFQPPLNVAQDAGCWWFRRVWVSLHKRTLFWSQESAIWMINEIEGHIKAANLNKWQLYHVSLSSSCIDQRTIMIMIMISTIIIIYHHISSSCMITIMYHPHVSATSSQYRQHHHHQTYLWTNRRSLMSYSTKCRSNWPSIHFSNFWTSSEINDSKNKWMNQ